MNLSQAAEQGVERLTHPDWGWEAYAKITIVNGCYGPWMDFFDRGVQSAIGAETPQKSLIVTVPKLNDYQPYTGPLDEADTSTP